MKTAIVVTLVLLGSVVAYEVEAKEKVDVRSPPTEQELDELEEHLCRLMEKTRSNMRDILVVSLRFFKRDEKLDSSNPASHLGYQNQDYAKLDRTRRILRFDC